MSIVCLILLYTISELYEFILMQDIKNKRNPRLVPYVLLDEKTKKTNRDSLCEAVRTLMGYGYNIEPPDQESCKYEEVQFHIKKL